MSVLERPTLVLNKSWRGINACTVREALVDVISERARIVHPQTYIPHDIESWQKIKPTKNELFIRCVSSRLLAPEVIVMNNYEKIPHHNVVFSRRNLWKRDHFCCQYCGKKPPHDEITVDHVQPRSRGGISSFKNCVLACIECNKKKDNKTPEEAGMPLVRAARDKNTNKMVYKYYNRPKSPAWSPIYSVRCKKIPASWGTFLNEKIDEMYWQGELEP